MTRLFPRNRSRVRAGGAASVIMLVTGLGLSLALSGCVPAPEGAPSPSASSSEPVTDATLVPGGNAEQNLPFFDKVNRATLAANPEAKGRDFIDALVAAGFAKADMQVTADITTIGLKANSIQFSIRLGDTCLVGQNGADSGGYNSKVAGVLDGTGTCLIGDTRPIDW